MNKGTLVRIRHNEHHGLFVVVSITKDERWAELLSLSTTERVHEMVRSLEVIDAER